MRRWDAAALAARLGVRVVAHGEIPSTMDAAEKDDGSLPVVHIAASQTAGRGRRGRRWESPPGNLYATIAWPDPQGCVGPGVLAAIQVAWTEAVASAGGPRTRCKWPNDGLIAGRKWAGALAARAGGPGGSAGVGKGREVLLLGLGANLETAPAGSDLGATALRDHWPAWPGREVVAALLLEAALDVLRGGSPAVRELLRRWRQHDFWKPGELLEVVVGNQSRRGRYAGLTPDGLLRLETEGGLLTLAVGEASRPHPFSTR